MLRRARTASTPSEMRAAPRRRLRVIGELLLGGLVLGASACASTCAPGDAGLAPTVGPPRRCDRATEQARQALLTAGRAVVVPALADLLERPEAVSPLADQARLGDVVQVRAAAPGEACRLPRDAFVEVETAEHYRGFVALPALRAWTEAAPYRSGPRERVVARLANVYPQPDLTKSNPMLVLPLGIELRRGRDVSTRWIEALLPDGRTGYIQRGDVGPAGAPALSSACVVEHSLLHDGTPYLWGGRSTLGIDCSGLVANAFAACGVLAPRDAHLQYDWTAMRPVAKDPTALRPGDLLFFGSLSASPASAAPGSGGAAPSPKITHVGVYVSEGRFVHSSTSERPAVHISEIGAPEWQQRWIGVRRHERLAAEPVPAVAPTPPATAAPAGGVPGQVNAAP